MTVQLPIELIDLIIEDLVTGRFHGYFHDVRSCSLVCHAWTPFAQAILFRRIALSSHSRALDFCRLAQHNSNLLTYVQRVTEATVETAENVETLLRIIPNLPKLQTLDITDSYRDTRKCPDGILFRPDARLRQIYLVHDPFPLADTWTSFVFRSLCQTPDTLEKVMVCYRCYLSLPEDILEYFRWDGPLGSLDIASLLKRKHPPTVSFTAESPLLNQKQKEAVLDEVEARLKTISNGDHLKVNII